MEDEGPGVADGFSAWITGSPSPLPRSHDGTGHVSADGITLPASYNRQVYSADFALSVDGFMQYMHALMAVAGANGISSSELQWIKDRAMMSAVPKRIVESLEHFDYRSVTLKEVLAADAFPDGQAYHRMLMHDAITLASQDAFDASTEIRAQQMRHLLDISDAELQEVSEIVISEQALRKQRKQVIWEVTE